MQSKSKRKKKGFTLVELLVVIMIIGIVLGISIPAVVNLQKSQNARKFDYFLTIVKEATDLYVEQYGKSFDETENCFDIVYDSLVEEDLIQESDITCLSSEGQQGIIQATRVPGTNQFTYQYFLTCTDRTTRENFQESGTAPTGCKGVNGNFVVNIDSAVKVVDGVTSDYTFDTWTRGKVIVTVSSVNPYFYDIDHYEYSLDGSNYTRMIGNQATFEASMNKKVYFRAVDTNGNYSGDTVAVIKIDNDKPTATINFSGTMGENNWYTSDVTASCANQSDGTGSGVASCTVTPGSYTSNTSGVSFTLSIVDNLGNSNTVSQTIKIDKTAPTCTSSGGTTSPIFGTVTLIGTCNDSESGCKGNVSKVFNGPQNLTNQSPGQVCNNAGVCTACPANQNVQISTNFNVVGGDACSNGIGSNITWSNSGNTSNGGGSGGCGSVRMLTNWGGSGSVYYGSSPIPTNGATKIIIDGHGWQKHYDGIDICVNDDSQCRSASGNNPNDTPDHTWHYEWNISGSTVTVHFRGWNQNDGSAEAYITSIRLEG